MTVSAAHAARSEIGGKQADKARVVELQVDPDRLNLGPCTSSGTGALRIRVSNLYIRVIY